MVRRINIAGSNIYVMPASIPVDSSLFESELNKLLKEELKKLYREEDGDSIYPWKKIRIVVDEKVAEEWLRQLYIENRDIEWFELLYGYVETDNDRIDIYIKETLFAHGQEQSVIHIRYEEPPPPECNGYELIGDIHSHHRMGAFFSATDEKHKLGVIQIVIDNWTRMVIAVSEIRDGVRYVYRRNHEDVYVNVDGELVRWIDYTKKAVEKYMNSDKKVRRGEYML